MNKILWTIVLTALPLLGHAASDELAAEYLQLSRCEQVWQDSIRTQVHELTKAMPADQSAGFAAFFQGVMSWPLMQNDMQRAVQELFTDEELRAANAFMRTPLGASLTAKSPALGVRMAELAAQRLQSVMEQLTAGDCKAALAAAPCPAK